MEAEIAEIVEAYAVAEQVAELFAYGRIEALQVRISLAPCVSIGLAPSCLYRPMAPSCCGTVPSEP
eukprot:886952-Rhodomonas_salina.1